MKNITLLPNEKVIVYLTVNTKNHKIYIGVHKTNNPYGFDGYLGCGVNRNVPSKLNNPKTHFHYAVKKYGFDAFRRITLKICDTYEEALKIESIIVDEKFVASDRTYNATLGGGDIPDCSIPCYRYKLTGEYIEEYSSCKEASEAIGCKEQSTVSHAALYKIPCKNSLWAFEKVDKINPEDFFISDYENKKKVIYVYNLDGSFYKEFPSYSDACKEIGGQVSDLTRAAKNKYIFQSKYYISFDKIDHFEKPIHKRHRKDPIYQYTLDGTFIKKWNTVKEAKDALGFTKLGDTLVTDKTYYGFQWSYTKLDKLPDRTIKAIRARKVGRYDDDWNLLEVFNTVTECSKTYGNVSKVLKGRMQKCKGFRFKYIDD